jgi:hypothetical protein
MQNEDHAVILHSDFSILIWFFSAGPRATSFGVG